MRKKDSRAAKTSLNTTRESVCGGRVACQATMDGKQRATHEGRNDKNRSQGLMSEEGGHGDDEVAREKRYGSYGTKTG
jgi:hypothetical protein